MTKEELLTCFAALQQETDLDRPDIHREVDDILLAYIDDHDITTAYHAIPKWYA